MLAYGGCRLSYFLLLVSLHCICVANEAREALAAQTQEHIDRAKQACLKEALHSTEATLTKLIAVPAVELLQTFPQNLWQQLHTVHKQVRVHLHPVRLCYC